MDIHVGDTLTMKKPHPCGSRDWLVLRIGADFRLRCTGCGHEVMGPRSKFEKNVRKILRPGTASGAVSAAPSGAGALASDRAAAFSAGISPEAGTPREASAKPEADTPRGADMKPEADT